MQLGFTAVASLWRLYLDLVAVAAEHRFVHAHVAERNSIARDSYNYFHLPIVAGIVLLALGLRKVFTDLDSPLKLVISFAGSGGVVLYLLGHLAFRYRNTRTWNVARAVVAVLLLAFIPLGPAAPAWISLVDLSSMLLGLAAYESLHHRGLRTTIRATRH